MIRKRFESADNDAKLKMIMVNGGVMNEDGSRVYSEDGRHKIPSQDVINMDDTAGRNSNVFAHV